MIGAQEKGIVHVSVSSPGLKGAETDVEVAQAVHQLVLSGVRVIFITERAARNGAETFQKYQTDPAVTLIPIPGSAGSDGLGMRRVHANVEKAIGADILFDDHQ